MDTSADSSNSSPQSTDIPTFGSTPPIDDSASPPMNVPISSLNEADTSSNSSTFIPTPDTPEPVSNDPVQQLVDQAQVEAPVVATKNTGGSGGSRTKRVFALLGVFLMIGGVSTGVYLVGRQQLSQTSAWDCGLYNFDVDINGVVTATNESSADEPAEKADIFINGELVAENVDVPALDSGRSKTIATVEVPSTGFNWSVQGKPDCGDSGIHEVVLSCPIDTGDGIFIDLTNSKVLRSDQDQSAAIEGPRSVSIPAGNYSVTLASYDGGHPEGQAQLNERWFARFTNTSGGVIAESSPINDLPEDQQFFTERVNGNLSFSQDATNITAVHAAYPDTTNPNSVQPVCLVLTPSEETTAQCNDVIAYDTSWNQLSLTELQALEPGNIVRFAVSGTASSGTFTKARFSINGGTPDETTTKRPGTEEFYVQYEIADDDVQISVTAEVEHSELGWL